MSSRINPYAADSAAMQAFREFDEHVNAHSLDPKLVELVKIRASQINGCAVCIEVHARRARDLGETELRLYLLSAWREATLYTPQERAALAWTEALTLVAETGAPDADYDLAHANFSDEELVELTFVIVTINAWNRFGVGFRRRHSSKPIAGSAQLAAASSD